jgi:hypothetical protein
MLLLTFCLIVLISSVIPGDVIRADPELASLFEQDQVSTLPLRPNGALDSIRKVSMWAWFGHQRASVCFPIVSDRDVIVNATPF